MIEIELTSNAQDVVAHLREFPPMMLQAIARAMDLENELTVGHIQAAHLTGRGPFPVEEHKLGVISDRLRPSVRPSPAEIEGQSVISAIGSNVAYAGGHEHGVDRMVTVAAHQRRLSIGNGKAKVWFDKGGHVRKAAAGKVATGQVREFQRHMRMPARAPITTGIQERAPNYSRSISAAIISAWEDQSKLT